MGLSVKEITRKSHEIEKIKELFYNSFPKQEQLPFWFLLYRAKSNSVNFLALFDKEVFVGFTYLVTNNDLTFVLYLAINNQIRSKGYGRMALEAIQLQYPANRIILNIEAIEKDTDNYEQRVKRKSFYTKNGYKNLPMLMIEGKDKYEVLISYGSSTIKEYKQLYKSLTGLILYWFFAPNIIYIPVRKLI